MIDSFISHIKRLSSFTPINIMSNALNGSGRDGTSPGPIASRIRIRRWVDVLFFKVCTASSIPAIAQSRVWLVWGVTRLSAENRFTRPIISRFTELTSSLVRCLFIPLSDGFSLVDCSRRFVHILLPTWHYPIGLPLCLYTERVHTRRTTLYTQ